MLLKNMQEVFKIFFRGMNTLRVRNKKSEDDEDYDSADKIESSLTVLERKKIV
jgi:hypothetical protein